MKKHIAIVLGLSATGLAFSGPFSNHHYNTFQHSSQPQVEVLQVQPRMVTTHQQVCEQVQVQHAPSYSSNTTGMVLGTLAGAALGSQVGKGSGRTIATATGAILGSELGRGTAYAQPPTVSYRNVCRQVPVTVQSGETVTFRYKGQVFTQTFN